MQYLGLLLAGAGLALAAVKQPFTLVEPAAIGTDFAKQGTKHCGGFNFHNRDTVSDFPVSGAAVKITQEHIDTGDFPLTMPYTVRAWLASEAEVPAYDDGNSTLGMFYVAPNQPDTLAPLGGVDEAWAGKDGVVQVYNEGAYQCAAVKFTKAEAGGAGGKAKKSVVF